MQPHSFTLLWCATALLAACLIWAGVHRRAEARKSQPVRVRNDEGCRR